MSCPSLLAEIGSLIDRFSADAVSDLIQLVRVATFNVLIGNAAAHGKNLAFLHDPHGGITLAPPLRPRPHRDVAPAPPEHRHARRWPRGHRRHPPGRRGGRGHRWPLDRQMAYDAAGAAAADILAALASAAAPAGVADSVAQRAEAS